MCFFFFVFFLRDWLAGDLGDQTSTPRLFGLPLMWILDSSTGSEHGHETLQQQRGNSQGVKKNASGGMGAVSKSTTRGLQSQ